MKVKILNLTFIIFIFYSQSIKANSYPSLIPLPEIKEETIFNENTTGEIFFNSRTPFDFDVLLSNYSDAPEITSTGTLLIPSSALRTKKIPAVVILPGSGGIKDGREMEYAKLLQDNGYAALVIDYYKSRGLDESIPYPLKIVTVTEFDIVSDAYSALKALAKHPSIDTKRIAVMGFSYGGIATRLAMDKRVHQAIAPSTEPFSAFVDYYGPCFQNFGTESTTGGALLTLRGADDSSNDLVACSKREEEIRNSGSTVASIVYPTAGHSWENLTPKEEFPGTFIRGCEMTYDDKGFPHVKGEALLAANTPINRKHRFNLRMQSGSFFDGCLSKGYITGRDDEVKKDSDKQLLNFLKKHLH